MPTRPQIFGSLNRYWKRYYKTCRLLQKFYFGRQIPQTQQKFKKITRPVQKGCLSYYISLLNISLLSFIKITVCMCFIQIKLSFHLQTSTVHPTHPILEIPQVKENTLGKGTSQPYYLIFMKSTFCADHMFYYNTFGSSQESQSISDTCPRPGILYS